jgi:hypothetical protein
MLFHLTTEDHIRNEPGPVDAGGGSFASERELQELACAWPMKHLVEIWNRLPGVEPVTRFTDRKTAIARIWRALQPQTDKRVAKAARRDSRTVFRAGSKAAQVCSLLSRPQGATLNEIRSETGWQAHTVRGFISRNLSKPGRKVLRSVHRARPSARNLCETAVLGVAHRNPSDLRRK